MFTYRRKIHVYETDLMGIVHHSNYLRFCEEARVAWFADQGLAVLTREDIFGLVVTETRVRHLRPIRLIEHLDIDVQVRTKGARLFMQYRLHESTDPTTAIEFARAETVHCRIDDQFKVLRLTDKVTQLMEKEKWIETWL